MHEPGDALPILAPREPAVEELEPVRRALPAAVARAAGFAASGFLLGASVVALLHRGRRHRSARPPRRGPVARRRRRRGELVRVVSTRSFLVDVHLLGRD